MPWPSVEGVGRGGLIAERFRSAQQAEFGIRRGKRDNSVSSRFLAELPAKLLTLDLVTTIHGSLVVVRQ
jgi:hypothetical protein